MIHSLEAEQSVIGGLLLNHTAFDLIADKVKEQHFTVPKHRATFRAISSLIADNKPADLVTVDEWLEANGENIGLGFLSDLMNNTPSTANITAYADIVRNKATERELLEAARDIEQLVHGDGDTRTKVDRAQSRIMSLAEQSVTSGPVMASSVIKTVIDNMEARLKKGGLLGLSTGFVDLDGITSGLKPSELVIVAGRPSMGKTALAMNIAEYTAVKQGKPALVFSMEMSNEQLVDRAISSLGRIPLNHVLSGKMEDSEWPRYTQATKEIHASPLVLDETGGLTVESLKTRARRVHRDRPLSLVVVDYLQLMKGKREENRNQELSEITRELKGLAKELKVPVVCLSQLNRGVETRPNKRPTMSDLRDSGAIEQDADLIAFVYRDEYYYSQSKAKGTAEIIIGKQRNGPTGMVRLTFNGACTRFDNYAGPPIEEEETKSDKWSGGFNG